MHVRIYVTDDGTQTGSMPVAFVNGRYTEAMPRHPQSLRWQYWGIVNDEDRLLDIPGNVARRSIQLQGFYISEQTEGESPLGVATSGGK
jgi:hypothetical protein